MDLSKYKEQSYVVYHEPGEDFYIVQTPFGVVRLSWSQNHYQHSVAVLNGEHCWCYPHRYVLKDHVYISDPGRNFSVIESMEGSLIHNMYTCAANALIEHLQSGKNKPITLEEKSWDI